MFNDVDFNCPARVYRAVIQVDGQPLCVQLSSVREYLLFKWRKHICNEVITVHFGASRETVENTDSKWIPYHCKHELFRVDIVLRLCSDVISGDGPHLAWRIGQQEPRLVPRDKMVLAILIRRCQNRNHIARISTSFLSQFRREQVWESTQMEG
jgi:hypothetical protein